MKTCMSIIILFFAMFFAISAASMPGTINPEEACIRRNIVRSQAPSSSAEPKRSKLDILVDKLCRDESRVVMFYLRLKGKFPSHYVKAIVQCIRKRREQGEELCCDEMAGMFEACVCFKLCFSLTILLGFKKLKIFLICQDANP